MPFLAQPSVFIWFGTGTIGYPLVATLKKIYDVITYLLGKSIIVSFEAGSADINIT